MFQGTGVEVKSNEINGMSMINVSEEVAQHLDANLPNHFLLQDKAFNLMDYFEHELHSDEIRPEHLWHLDKIRLPRAREKGLGAGKGIKIAVLDTGVDGTHPELQGKIAVSYNKYMEKLSQHVDTAGHGTKVASLICGKNMGVAPDAQLINVVLLERSKGSLVDFIWVLNELVQQYDVPIVNISGGLYNPHDDPRLHTLVRRYADKQIFLVVATGNNGPGKTLSPGNFREVISVGASTKGDEIDKIWKRSGGNKFQDDRGEYFVPDIVAPGASVYAADMKGGIKKISGTSFAAPIVSGVLALLVEKFRANYNDFTVDDVLCELYKTCTDLGSPKERQGNGMLTLD